MVATYFILLVLRFLTNSAILEGRVHRRVHPVPCFGDCNSRHRLAREALPKTLVGDQALGSRGGLAAARWAQRASAYRLVLRVCVAVALSDLAGHLAAKPYSDFAVPR